MSWPSWSSSGTPIPTPMANPVQTTLLPGAINSAPAVMAPVGYSQEQWAQVQQQNWQQWAQWQQQYQQWHQQYGAEYQKSLNAMQGSLSTVGAVQPPLPTVVTSVPMENRPPLPPEEPPQPHPTVPPVAYSSNQHINSGYSTTPLVTQHVVPTPLVQATQTWPNVAQKRPLNADTNYDQAKRAMLEKPQTQWKPAQNYNQPPPKVAPTAKPNNPEELSEAEKKFDKEFAAWEAQFNKWKEQNANHPDKTQYKEYEKKWESWRNSLLERREQMRRKRLGLSQTGSLNKPLTTIVQENPATKPQQTSDALKQSQEQISVSQSKDLFLKPTKENTESKGMDESKCFLKCSSSEGIPGLDLVKDDVKDENLPDRFDNKESDQNKNENGTSFSKGPDFEAISKGINSILGDQKLLNMLSLVSQKQPTETNVTKPTPEVSTQFTQNFSVPPPTYSLGNVNEPPPAFNNNYSNVAMENNQFSQKPPYNFNSGVANNMQGNINNRNFNEKNQYSRASGSFNTRNDNFNRNNRNNDQFNEIDNYRDDSRNNDSFNEPNFNNNQMRNQGKQFDRSNNYENYDNYDDEEDYDRYNDMFQDEDDQYQNVGYQNNETRKIPALMDQIAPAPPEICPPEICPPVICPPVVEEEQLFEPNVVIDYEHKSKKNPEDDVRVEPINMFDYRHKPLNRIPLPQRPKWLAEAVKFIREFDPTAVRYERNTPMDKYPIPREENTFLRFEPRDSLPRFERGGGDRHNRSYDREKPDTMDRSRYGDDFVNRNDRYKPLDTHNRDTKRTFTKRNEQIRLNTDDLEDLSDSDMDFEQCEQVRHHNIVGSRNKSKSPELSNPPNPSSSQVDITMIEDIINPPGRYNRPPRIVIILRGPPGSGKTFLAKQIKDKEIENGGSAPRILSLDDYFLVEQEVKKVEDGKVQVIKKMVYEYEPEMEDSYRTSFLKSFKKTVTDGYFPFIIVDNVNDKVKHFGEMWSFAKQNGFQMGKSPKRHTGVINVGHLPKGIITVFSCDPLIWWNLETKVYICQMELDLVQCTKRNVHNRSEADIQKIISNWEPTPSHHPTIDASGLLQLCAITEVEMEVEDRQQETNVADSDPEDQVRSKWDNFDCSSNNLAKLDGVSKPLRKSHTMEEYLQLEDQWEFTESTPGKKRVRWADLEEKRQQEKMRAIGFVVGHTNWDRMMDQTEGRSALVQTKYIEKISRNKYI